MHLFAYGSLLLPEVMRAVTGRTFRAQGAVLRGYAAFRLMEAPQAAILPFPDTATEGAVYFDVDEASLRCLDAFEGDVYARQEVNVQTEDGAWVEAEAHVIRFKHRRLLSAKLWDEDEFRSKGLNQALKHAAESRKAGVEPQPS